MVMGFPCGRVPRRRFLADCGLGFTGLALGAMLQRDGVSRARAESEAQWRPPSGLPHFPAKAKSVIFLFMEGGPSHLDTFDYKPLLNKLAGQSLPASFKAPITAMGETKSPLLECKRTWKQHGQGGLWISDWFNHVAKHADDLAVINSCASSGIGAARNRARISAARMASLLRQPPVE